MAEIMTARELAKYLKLHEITIGKYAAKGKIPACRIGRAWRFSKEAIDKWISGDQKQHIYEAYLKFSNDEAAKYQVKKGAAINKYLSLA